MKRVQRIKKLRVDGPSPRRWKKNASPLAFNGSTTVGRRFWRLYWKFMRETDSREEELCRQLSSLIVQRELLDAAIMRGEVVDPNTLVRLSGVITRTIAVLRKKQGDKGKGQTPAQYLAANGSHNGRRIQRSVDRNDDDNDHDHEEARAA
jgi:hypothetical protein